MPEITQQTAEISAESFDALLNALDAASRDNAAQKYLELRSNLQKFFGWRGFCEPETHVDETLNRAARKIAAGETILDVRSYIFGIARFLTLEINRREEKQRLALAEISRREVPDSEEKERFDAKFSCLKKCLGELESEERELVVGYYRGEKTIKIENRRRLLEKLKLSPSGLRMKVLRLREQLENCLEKCVEQTEI